MNVNFPFPNQTCIQTYPDIVPVDISSSDEKNTKVGSQELAFAEKSTISDQEDQILMHNRFFGDRSPS